MAKMIWKFQLSSLPTTEVLAYRGTEFLTVQNQDGKWVVWGIVDTDEPPATLFIERFGTGWDLPELQPNEERIYLSTTQQGPFVWHFFVRQQKRCEATTPDPVDRIVKVRIKHESSIRGTRWCELVDCIPTNVLPGNRYNLSERLWLPANGGHPTFGIVVHGNYQMNQEVLVSLSKLRVIKSGNCEDVGPVMID